MLRPQTATNRHKKASSALTPKASHLTVVPTTNRNTAMNNTTATDFNSQIDEAYNTASNALDCVTLAMEHIGGLEALFKSIFLQTKDKQGLKEVLNASKL